MSRPTDWTPLNEYSDPVPGNPDAVWRAASRYAGVADTIKQAARDLVRVFEDDQLKGESFDALREIATEVSSRIERAHERYQGVSDALGGYVQPLRDAQSISVEILTRAESNRTEGATADERVQYWRDELTLRAQTGAPDVHEAIDRLNYWTQQQSQSQQDVGSLIAELNRVISDRDTAATVAANAIAEVENSGSLNDDFWDNVDDFLTEHPWIDTVINVVSVAVAVLAIVAMFVPGLNLLVLAVSIVVAAAVIANAWAKAGTGRQSIAGAILETALALVPFARPIMALASTAKVAVTSASASSMMASAAGSGLSGITRPVATNVVDQFLGRNPSQWLRLPNGAPNILNKTSDFGDLLDLSALAKTDVLLAGGTSAGAMAAMSGVRNEFAVDLLFNSVDVVVSGIELGTGVDPVQAVIETVTGIVDQPNNSWQNSDW